MKILYEEYLIYDNIHLIGSIGGTLGMCIGFSFTGIIQHCAIFFIKKFKHKIPNTILQKSTTLKSLQVKESKNPATSKDDRLSIWIESLPQVKPLGEDNKGIDLLQENFNVSPVISKSVYV